MVVPPSPVWRALVPVIRLIGRVPLLRDGLLALIQYRSAATPFGRRHPFDRRHGVATSGAVPGFALGKGDAVAYAAAQPSIIRTAIAAIPAVAERHFVDLGCGKGRPLFVAAQCGFRAVTGVEFNPTLARVARHNAQRFARAMPAASPIAIVQGDATLMRLPPEPLVLFLYNPFSDATTAKVIAALERSLRATPREVFVIAYNPVAAALFDASPALKRFYAGQIPYAPEEIGFGPDRDDAVVIWCDRGNTRARPPGDHAGAVLRLSAMRAILAPDGALER